MADLLERGAAFFDTEAKDQRWKSFETMREPFEERAIELLGDAFKRQEAAVVRALRGAA